MIISTPLQVVSLCKDIRDKKKEHLVGIYLDARRTVLHREIISIGTVDSSIAHPREVFEPAIRFLASQLILVHNHPTGDPTPSSADIYITQRIQEAGELLGIQLTDHIIITSERYISFVEERIM